MIKWGDPLTSAAISGTNIIPSAFSMEGGLTLVGSASEDVIANGNPIPINAANRLEFIAKYNDLCQFEKIVPVWNLDPSQYPNSRAMMDPVSGDLYLAGVSYQPYNLVGHGILGKEYGDYMYVLRYDRNLALTGVFTAGFDELDTEYGYYEDLRITPAMNGTVIISGTWQGDRTPVIAGDTLGRMVDGQGVFALKLDREFRKEWVLEGSLQGFDIDGFSGISEGIALADGDLVMVGATSTGHFSLGEVKIEYPNGAGFSNMFAFKITAEGKPMWISQLENKNEVPIGKKGTDSEEFTASMEWDAVAWNEELLYLAGKFSGDQFSVAGRPLANNLGKGIFVAALDLGSGEERWGYSISSDRTYIHGFDLDASGNVSLMGRTGSFQELEGYGPSPVVDGTDLILHLGLDNLGKPLWHNNAYNANVGFNTFGCDLEVLKNGAVFSSLYKTVPDPLLIGGASIPSKDIYSSVLVALKADNILGGKVTDKSGNPLYPGVVRAYKVTDRGAYPIVQTVDIDDSGSYLFSGLIPGNYALRVIPNRDAYPDGMPTYSGGGITWSAPQTEAYDVASDTRATFLNVSLSHLDPLTEVDGSGQMSGNISYSDDFILKGTMARPVTNTSVILKKKAASKGTQEDDIVAYIETDDFGIYYFENVPNGEYFMIVDIPGLAMTDNYDVAIIDNIVVGGLDFVVEDEGITTTGATAIEPEQLKLVRIFPNPGNGNLHMELRNSGDYRVRVFDALGKMVDFREFPSVSGDIEMDISDQKRGIYLITIEGEGVHETIKYVRR